MIREETSLFIIVQFPAHSCIRSKPPYGFVVSQIIYTQIYNIFLIIVLTILSLKFCTARPVSREILYFSFISVLSTIIWSIWIGAGYILPSQYSDLSSSVTILSSVVIIFSATLLSRGIREGKVIPGTSISIFTGNNNSKERLLTYPSPP